MADTPRRVLMTVDAVGGVWVYARELATGLARCGVEVALASMGPRPTAAQRAEVLAIDGVTLHETDHRLEWMDEPWADVDAAGAWLLELEARLAPDVVHVNGYAHAALPFRAKVACVAHSCVLSWWRAVLGEEAPARYDEYRRRVVAGLAAAGAVVAPTAAMLDEVRRCYGLPLRGTVVLNAVSARHVAPGDKMPYIFCAARVWDAAKNVPLLAEAAATLPWPVIVAGDDRHPDGARCTPPGVETLGRLDTADLARWMAGASIYALPALYEPFGLSVLEAGLARCALVLGDIPTLREVWGDAAIFVDPRDAGALSRALDGLASDARRRRILGDRAHARARAIADADMTGAYLDMYRGCRGGLRRCA